MSAYDLYLQEPYLREEEGCTCAGLSAIACPVHDQDEEGCMCGAAEPAECICDLMESDQERESAVEDLHFVDTDVEEIAV